MTHGALIIGYGNVLRSDDGIGWHVAEHLATDGRFEGVAILQRHQLTPELALDVSRADLVALVDATQDRAAGTFAIERLAPNGDATTTWSHRMEPSTVVALARELYGRAPEVYVLSVGAASLEVGDRLSPALEAIVPHVVDALAALVATGTGYGQIAAGNRA